jgi:hypothetical protein
MSLSKFGWLQIDFFSLNNIHIEYSKQTGTTQCLYEQHMQVLLEDRCIYKQARYLKIVDLSNSKCVLVATT